jgi:4-coumarate--CoA ligase
MWLMWEVYNCHPNISIVSQNIFWFFFIVIGIPHPTFGEVPKAFVVKRSNKDVTEKEIQDFVADKVAPFKKLEGGVTFLDAIPKNNTGKIMRRTLKEKYC